MGSVSEVGREYRVRTVFISDVHLGHPGCASGSLLNFLERVQCETLYLVGDIIDFWYLAKRKPWPAQHSEVLQSLLRKAQQGTRVILVPGNHDETLRQYCGLSLGPVEVVDRCIHETADGQRLLVLHGDQFDSVVRCSPLLAMVGSNLYDLLLQMNGWIHAIRKRLGRDYWSLSAAIKMRVKKAVQYIGRYEEAVVRAARRQQVDGVVCGHIHRAEISRMEDILYLNCGDWVESCTAIVEQRDGRMELLHWPATAQPSEPERSFAAVGGPLVGDRAA